MKVALLINDLILGGAQKVFVDQANFLSAQGHEVYLFVLYDIRDKKTYINDLSLSHKNIHWLGMTSLFDRGGYQRLFKIVKLYNLDLMYATLDDANFVAKVCGLIFSDLTVIIREANVVNKKSLTHFVSGLVLNWFVDKFVCVSKEVRRTMLKWEPWLSRRTVIIENGISLPEETVTHSKRSIIKCISVGTLTPKKGMIELVEIFADLPANYHLRIVGEGTMADALKAKISELDLGQRVVLAGSISHQLIGAEYLQADIFVLNSKWEGFPNVLLEAMSYGLPPVATIVSGTAELIVKDFTGYLSNFGDKETMELSILRLGEDLDLRSKIGFNARKHVAENFSHNRQMSKLEAELNNTLNG
jgi:glycosyltransferase involved in cell wall biosynthesis